jgi:site-specific DNA recombinase
VIYARVSTKEQVDEGNSLSTQEKICREYANKNEFEIAAIFIEQGESAKTANRTELKKLLAYCADKKNRINAVIIYKLDRLSRNTDDYSQLRLLLKRYSVEIKSTTEYFEDTPVGRFMENTMSNIAQFDNDIRTERSVGGMKEAMRDGRYVWPAPVGYDNMKVLGRANIAQNKVMAPIILKTFNLVAQNIYSTEEIRRMMIKEGLVNRKGKPHAKSYFYTMLTNVAYAGWIKKFGEKHKGTYTPIVSDDLFDQVQRVLKGRGRKHSAYVTDHPDFPLRRFVTNELGKKITGSWSQGRSKKYPYYNFGSVKSNYNRDRFEEMFMNHMDKFKFDDQKFNKLKKCVQENIIKTGLNNKRNSEQLKRTISDLTEKQSGIIKKNLDGVIPDEVLKQQLALIDKDLNDANTSLARIPNTDINYEEALDFIEDFLKNPSKVWKFSKLPRKVKLQWFQFPSGLLFQNKKFRTSEISIYHKRNELFLTSHSSKVHLRDETSNTPKMKSSPKLSISAIKKINMQKVADDIVELSKILKGEDDDVSVKQVPSFALELGLDTLQEE